MWGLTDPIKKRKYGARRYFQGPNDLALGIVKIGGIL